MDAASEQPLVSVIIPAYDCEEVLSRAIQSVLEQSIKELEIIVIDDNSPDDLCEVISSFSDKRIEYKRHKKNKGGSAARNSGIRLAQGEYIAFLDADDAWHPNKLEKQVTYLNSNPKYGACYCDFVKLKNDTHIWALYNEWRRQIKTPKERPSGGQNLIEKTIKLDGFNTGGMSSIMVKRDILMNIGGFDPSFPRHQDWEFRIRLLKATKIGYLQEVLVEKYDHGSVPDVKNIKESKRLLYEKFEKEFDEIEQKGDDPYTVHQKNMAVIYIRNGELQKGIKMYISEADASIKDTITLFSSITFGLANRFTR